MKDKKLIEIAPGLLMPGHLFDIRQTGAGGPGGQHVNRSLTAVQLRFDIKSAPLPERVKQRLFRLAGRKLTAEGILVLTAREHRSANRNRQEAFARLRGLVERAMTAPPQRRPTRPSSASKKVRLDTKKKRARLKVLRQKVDHSKDGYA